MLGFRGMGYSEEFVENMGKVVAEFNSGATLPVIVLAVGDVVCTACPHYQENKCHKKADSEMKVRTKDLAVIQRLGLAVGIHIAAGEVRARIKERLSVSDLVQICRDCEWLGLGYCAEGLERLEPG